MKTSVENNHTSLPYREGLYDATLQYLYNSTPVFEHVGAAAYKEGLSNTLALDEHFGHPHTRFQTIHVAGTNGKGSCSHTLAAILQADGYRVGLYTSPHLVDFRERIRVNGKHLSQQYVIDFVEQHRSFFEPLHPSFFELTTAMAFKYFAEQQVDIAIIEVGLGGRLDCTNIIRPRLSIITNISFDHTQFLGDTLAKIAAEKAGIIKPHVPVIIGETTPETRTVFEQKAAEQEAPIIFAEDCPAVLKAHQDQYMIYQTTDLGELEGELTGAYQAKNANTVLTACKELTAIGILRSVKSIRQGFRNVCETTGLLGRWQQLQVRPTVICDTGHNIGGWQYLAPQISQQPCKTCRIVLGMVDDKDLDAVLALLPSSAKFYWTQATTHRAIPSDHVAERARKHGLQGTPYPTVAAAYRKALADASEDDFIFVGGSSYVVADLLTSLQENHIANTE